MSPYYPTLAEDLARAKEILAKGAVDGLTILPPPVGSTAAHGTSHGPDGSGHIYGADIYAAYKLLESFVAHIETHFRPDHNGECLNCDETEDAHGLIEVYERFEAKIRIAGRRADTIAGAEVGSKRQRQIIQDALHVLDEELAALAGGVK